MWFLTCISLLFSLFFHLLFAYDFAQKQRQLTSSLLATFHQQQQLNQLRQAAQSGCPEHPNGKGVDCKTCELLECSFYGIGTDSIRLPRTPSKSPNGNGSIADFSQQQQSGQKREPCTYNLNKWCENTHTHKYKLQCSRSFAADFWNNDGFVFQNCMIFWMFVFGPYNSFDVTTWHITINHITNQSTRTEFYDWRMSWACKWTTIRSRLFKVKREQAISILAQFILAFNWIGQARLDAIKLNSDLHWIRFSIDVSWFWIQPDWIPVYKYQHETHAKHWNAHSVIGITNIKRHWKFICVKSIQMAKVLVDIV